MGYISPAVANGVVYGGSDQFLCPKREDDQQGVELYNRQLCLLCARGRDWNGLRARLDGKPYTPSGLRPAG
jgi:hypothetical protein